MPFRNIKKRIFLLISILLISSVFIQTAVAEPRISEAVFAKSVKNHKPINQLDTLNDDLEKLYFFTDIRGYQGHTITHQWTYGDWVVQSLPFTIKGHRWRVSSSKTLDKKMKGKWTVKVLDENGTTLQENSIAYSRSASQITPKDKVKINTDPKQNKVEEKQRENTSEVDKTNTEKEVKSKEITQKNTETKTQNTSTHNANKVEGKEEVKPKEITQKKIDEVKEEVDHNSKKAQSTSKNSDDGDEEDCEPDEEAEANTPNKSEAEALLTDDDFELKADTKQDDAVAKMAKTVIEQLEKMPTRKTE